MNLSLPIANPTLIFLVVLLVILLAPIIMGKLRIPHIIGMVLAGVALGEFGFNILERDDSFQLFGRVGLYYIMFLASLELNMEGLKKSLRKVVSFGLLSFLIPFLLTWAASLWLLHYNETTALLLGCIMASNTLIAYPIVGKFGLQRKPSVLLSVGGTMIALLLALIGMAIIVSANRQSGGAAFWLLFVVKMAVYCAGIVFFVPRLTRWFLRRYSDAVMQFIFVLAIVFLCASLSEMVGLEGILGAFLAGLILNRYIPQVSPLMQRLEFIGNALFIPYFLIGVGMLINVRLLLMGGSIVWVVLCFVLFGTLGKAIASYLSCLMERLPISSGHMMFGLTSAHAAGAIAMVMVGINQTLPNGQPMVTGVMLNGIIIMILFTCIISSILTEQAARQITLRDAHFANDEEGPSDQERMLIPMKYPEYADKLLSLALLMKNPRLDNNMVALNVVYDDSHMRKNQEQGQELLQLVQRQAATANQKLTTQVRIAANIANGIKHAFKEFQASEILIGMHMHDKVSTKFWGQFHQSLFNGLSRQIIMARLVQPLNTIRRIQVAVPSRAQYEPGFYQWLERLARLAQNLDCRIQFHAREDTTERLKQYIRNRHPDVRADYQDMEHWNQLPHLATTIADDHLFVVVTARRGTISYKNAQDRLPDELTRFFKGKNLMIVFPDQHGDLSEAMTFAQSQHTEERSAYEEISEWIKKKVKR